MFLGLSTFSEDGLSGCQLKVYVKFESVSFFEYFLR